MPFSAAPWDKKDLFPQMKGSISIIQFMLTSTSLSSTRFRYLQRVTSLCGKSWRTEAISTMESSGDKKVLSTVNKTSYWRYFNFSPLLLLVLLFSSFIPRFLASFAIYFPSSSYRTTARDFSSLDVALAFQCPFARASRQESEEDFIQIQYFFARTVKLCKVRGRRRRKRREMCKLALETCPLAAFRHSPTK